MKCPGDGAPGKAITVVLPQVAEGLKPRPVHIVCVERRQLHHLCSSCNSRMPSHCSPADSKLSRSVAMRAASPVALGRLSRRVEAEVLARCR
jgi:hypothetical protein